jgi:hypothetical protein
MASANNAATCPRSDARAVSAVSPCPLAAAVEVVEKARLTLGGVGTSMRADAAPTPPTPPPPPPTVIRSEPMRSSGAIAHPRRRTQLAAIE